MAGLQVTLTPDPSASPFQHRAAWDVGQDGSRTPAGATQLTLVPFPREQLQLCCRQEKQHLHTSACASLTNPPTASSPTQEVAWNGRTEGHRVGVVRDWPSIPGPAGSEQSCSLHYHNGTDTPPASNEHRSLVHTVVTDILKTLNI